MKIRILKWNAKDDSYVVVDPCIALPIKGNANEWKIRKEIMKVCNDRNFIYRWDKKSDLSHINKDVVVFERKQK